MSAISRTGYSRSLPALDTRWANRSDLITMRMGVYALLAVSACAGAAFAQAVPNQAASDQNPAQPLPQTQTADGQPDSSQSPLAPVQERNQQIRQIDPLAREDDKESRDKAKAARDAEKRRDQDQTATPGSIAASEQNSARRSGPQVVEDENEAVQEYSGPAVLSRSYSINQPLIPQQLKWQESLGLSSIYDSGISKQINANGLPGAPSTLTGAQLTWSLSGRHYFRRDEVSVSYSGNYSQYSGLGAFSGMNQNIVVDYAHVVSRRLTLNLSGSGSILSQNYVLENQPVGPETIANINLASSPNIQIYDLGTKQFSSAADLTWQKTSRLSFSIGTSYFAIDRSSPLGNNSPSLLGVTGQQARGDVNYRLTRKMTVGSYYSFSHYVYPHGFGNSDTNTVGAITSYAFNRTTQIRFRGGLSWVESVGLQTVAINPVIAALLGQNSGIIDAYNTYRASDISAQFVKDFRGRTTASLAYARGISPGNGVFQTSQQESISGNVTTKVFRTYSVQTSLGRDTLSSVSQYLGKYQSEYGRISLVRTYRRGIGLSLTAEYRYFDVANLGYVRNQLRITSGLTWSPAAGRLWPF